MFKRRKLVLKYTKILKIQTKIKMNYITLLQPAESVDWVGRWWADGDSVGIGVLTIFSSEFFIKWKLSIFSVDDPSAQWTWFF